MAATTTTTASTEQKKKGRPVFEPDGASARAIAVQDQASPTQTSTALARFEFESGRGNEGTKILMVEWQDDAKTRRRPGEWHVAWENQSSTSMVLSAKDRSRQDVHRLYFLLLPGVTIPPIITLTHNPASVSASSDNTMADVTSSSSSETTVWRITPLPAIFPTELGASARSHGKKGVLHTIWAKKRMSELQREIESESRTNIEGVGLQMALQEKEWIEQNFGIAGRPAGGLSMPPGLATTAGSDEWIFSSLSPTTPISPKTPGGSNRLAEKLKGLRVGTSERELLCGRQGTSTTTTITANNLPLTAPPTAEQEESGHHLLSPDTSDVAISSFTTGLDDHQPSSSTPHHQNPSFPKQQQQQPPKPKDHHHTKKEKEEEEDDLFAVALSPRSPDMTKSPFSFFLTG